MRFHFNFRTYFTMVRLAWGEKNPQARYYYLAVLLLAVPVVSTFHAICFFLDGILFPGMLKVEVRSPVFVIGHARSGTTLVHRLMTQDAGRFSSFMMYEMYFPSLLQKKFIRFMARMDAEHVGGVLERRVKAWEEKRYGKFNDIHRMGLTLHEEDEIVFYYSCASGFWITKMPYMGDLDFYDLDNWPESRRRRQMDFYEDCLRRQLYLDGTDKTYIMKNPTAAGRVETLIEKFPDARFVVPLRNPHETIPSLLKLMVTGWRALQWDPERQKRCLRFLADQAYHTYLHPFEVLERHPEIPYGVVDYREVTTDPAAAIEKAYKDIGLPITPEYREVLAALGKREREHTTSHSYSLDEFGLESGEIRRELATLFEQYGWDADTPEA